MHPASSKGLAALSSLRRLHPELHLRLVRSSSTTFPWPLSSGSETCLSSRLLAQAGKQAQPSKFLMARKMFGDSRSPKRDPRLKTPQFDLKGSESRILLVSFERYD